MESVEAERACPACLSMPMPTETPNRPGTSDMMPRASWPDQHGFLSGYKDDLGLTHLGAREYDPATGRFISDDPVTGVSDPADQRLHPCLICLHAARARRPNRAPLPPP